VYNKNEDFYAVRRAKACPEYDVLVTNPPFSADHIDRIFKFAVASGKPWFLLIPAYVSNSLDSCSPQRASQTLVLAHSSVRLKPWFLHIPACVSNLGSCASQRASQALVLAHPSVRLKP
jgi:hypothetical protein